MELLTYSFIQHSIIAIIITSIISGIIGTIIVEKKLVIFSGGLAHTTFGGIGLGYLLNINPLFTGIIFTITSSLLILSLSKKFNANKDTFIAMFWALGMALGILFISFIPGYPPDITTYLFGNILTTSINDIILISIILIITLLFIIPLFNHIKLYLFDETFMKTLNINTNFFDIFIYILISLCIVSLTKIVGIILVIALLSIPTAVSKLYFNKLSSIIFSSIFISMLCCFIGLYCSYLFDISASSIIVITLAISYIFSIIINKIF